MLLIILIAVIVPMALLVEAAGDYLPHCFRRFGSGVRRACAFLSRSKTFRLSSVFQWLTSMVEDRTQSAVLLQRALEPAGKLSLAFVRLLGDGLLQLLLVTFIVFFYYRDGDRIAQLTHRISRRLSVK